MSSSYVDGSAVANVLNAIPVLAREVTIFSDYHFSADSSSEFRVIAPFKAHGPGTNAMIKPDQVTLGASMRKYPQSYLLQPTEQVKTSQPQRQYSIDEAARILAISPQAIKTRIEKGVLATDKFHGRTVLTSPSFDKLCSLVLATRMLDLASDLNVLDATDDLDLDFKIHMPPLSEIPATFSARYEGPGKPPRFRDLFEDE